MHVRLPFGDNRFILTFLQFCLFFPIVISCKPQIPFRKMSISLRLPYHESKVIGYFRRSTPSASRNPTLSIETKQEGLSVLPLPCLLTRHIFSGILIFPILIVMPNIFCPFTGWFAVADHQFRIGQKRYVYHPHLSDDFRDRVEALCDSAFLL